MIKDIYSEHKTLTILKTQTTQFFKWAKYLNRHLTEEDTQMANKHKKRCSSISHFRTANQNHNEVSTHSLKDYNKKYSTTKCWWGCGENVTLIRCWWEYKKSTTPLESSDSLIEVKHTKVRNPLLGYLLKRNNTQIIIITTQMFIAALFLTVTTGKNPNPLNGENTDNLV